MARADLEAAFGAVVCPVLGFGEHDQMRRFHAAYGAAFRVVNVLVCLDRPAKSTAITTRVASTVALLICHGGARQGLA